MRIGMRPKWRLRGLAVGAIVAVVLLLLIVPRMHKKEADLQAHPPYERFAEVAETIADDNCHVTYSYYFSNAAGTLTDELRREMSSIILDTVNSNPNKASVNIDNGSGYEVCFYIYTDDKETATITTSGDYFVLNGEYKCFVDRSRLDRFRSKIRANTKNVNAEQETVEYVAATTQLAERKTKESTTVWRKSVEVTPKETTTSKQTSETLSFRIIDSLDISKIAIGN